MKPGVGIILANPKTSGGARGATTTFVQRGIGDVLVGWENEAYLAIEEAKGQVEIVVPAQSILAEPPVAVVDKVATKKGNKAVADAYVQFLYSPEGQEIAREASLPPARSEGRGQVREQLREGEPLHD